MFVPLVVEPDGVVDGAGFMVAGTAAEGLAKVRHGQEAGALLFPPIEERA